MILFLKFQDIVSGYRSHPSRVLQNYDGPFSIMRHLYGPLYDSGLRGMAEDGVKPVEDGFLPNLYS